MISNCQLLNIWSFAPKSFKNCIFKHREGIFLSEKSHLHWHNSYCCFEDHSVKLDLAEYPRNKVRLLSHPSEAPRPKRKAKPLSRPPLSFWTFVTLAQCHLIGVQTTCFSWSTTVAWPGRCVSRPSPPTLPVAQCVQRTTLCWSSSWKWENSVGLHSVRKIFENEIHFYFYPFRNFFVPFQIFVNLYNC